MGQMGCESDVSFIAIEAGLESSHQIKKFASSNAEIINKHLN